VPRKAQDAPVPGISHRSKGSSLGYTNTEAANGHCLGLNELRTWFVMLDDLLLTGFVESTLVSSRFWFRPVDGSDPSIPFFLSRSSAAHPTMMSTAPSPDAHSALFPRKGPLLHTQSGPSQIARFLLVSFSCTLLFVCLSVSPCASTHLFLRSSNFSPDLTSAFRTLRGTRDPVCSWVVLDLILV